MKKILITLMMISSVGFAQNFSEVVKSNEELMLIDKNIKNKIESLKKDIEVYKKAQIAKIQKDMEVEQKEYEDVIKGFNFFKLKHEKNIYAKPKIKANEAKAKEISKNHLDFKKRNSIKVEQLSHANFVPKQKKSVQEEIFFFEIKSEEFREIFEVNKKRYDNSIKLAIGRFKEDSNALSDEFKELKYKKIK